MSRIINKLGVTITGTIPGLGQICQRLFTGSFSVCMTVPFRLQTSSFSTDLILSQTKRNTTEKVKK